MLNQKSKSILIILFAILSLLCFGMFFTVSANADMIPFDRNKKGIYADNGEPIFEFKPAIQLTYTTIENPGENESPYNLELSWQFETKKSNYYDVHNFCEFYDTGIGYDTTDQWFSYTFNLYCAYGSMGNNDTTRQADLCYSQRITYATNKSYESNKLVKIISEKKVANRPTLKINKLNGVYSEESFDWYDDSYYWYNSAKRNGYSIKSLKITNEKGPDTGWRITTQNVSPYQIYFVTVEVQHHTQIKKKILKNTCTTTFKKTCNGYASMVSAFLQDRKEDGTYDTDNFINQNETMKALCDDIYENSLTKEITVRYLVPINGTPFAYPKTKNITVKSTGDVVNSEEIIFALKKEGIELKEVLGSYIKNFTLTNGIYVAKYYQEIWLRTATEDGNYFDYFLDLNKSFKDYFQDFVDRGIVPNGLYNWFFANQIDKYPALKTFMEQTGETLGEDELYGYFGLIITPNAGTLNQAFKQMFNINENIENVLSWIKYPTTISKNTYESIMEDYNYGFLAKIWGEIFSEIITGANATVYVTVFEPGTEQAFIAEGGQQDRENPGTAIDQTVENFFDGVGNAFKEPLVIIFVAIVLILVTTLIVAIIKNKKE